MVFVPLSTSLLLAEGYLLENLHFGKDTCDMLYLLLYYVHSL